MLETLHNALFETFRIIDLTGVILNGILGGKLARDRGFDLVGFVVLALMSALGGGIVRDLMLAAGPPLALTDPYYLIMAIAGALIAFLWKLESRFWSLALLVADGVVLGAWAATGAIRTLDNGFGVVPALVLGIMTAVGGGMIRDVTAGVTPRVFGGNNLYATPAFVSAAVMVGVYQLGEPVIGMLAATIVGSSFTIVAHWRNWRLPQNPDWTLSLSPEQLLGRRAQRRKPRPIPPAERRRPLSDDSE